jgi:hypothetical protein
MAYEREAREFIRKITEQGPRVTRRHELADRLKSSGIAQVDASQFLEVSHVQLNRYLNGYARMPVRIEQKLEALLKAKEI